MDNDNTLEHLLKIEAEAAALVKDAQAEADRRIHENEENNRKTYEERFKVEVQKHESALRKEIEKQKEKYQQMLEDYRNGISNAKTDVEKFSALFNRYVADTQ
jgi:vacuolar-type H+-ATPase subunit H